MPRVAASNGIRPEIRALAVIKVGVPVTPAEINDHVGTGDYAAKYISFLNTRYGFNIIANKDGRRVVSYTMISEPENASILRSSTASTKIVIVRENGKILAKLDGTKNVKTAKSPKAPKSKTVTVTVPSNFETAVTGAKIKVAPKAKTKPTKSVAEIKAANLAKLKEVGAAHKKLAKRVREFDDVTETFGTTGEVGTSFNVDGDWDSVEGLDLKNLL